MRARTTSTARLAAAAAGLALLAGCGGGATGDDRTEGSPPSSPAAAASPTATADTPTEPPSPAAATGPVLRMDVAEVNVPEGWKRLDPLVPLADTAGAPDSVSTITLSARSSFGGTLDELARISARTGAKAGQVRRAPDTEIAGVPVYHLVEKPSSPQYANVTLDEYAAIHGGQVVTVIMNLDRSLSEVERTRIHDEVLASFVWK